MDVLARGDRTACHADDLAVLAHLAAGWDVHQCQLVAGRDVITQAHCEVAGVGHGP